METKHESEHLARSLLVVLALACLHDNARDSAALKPSSGCQSVSTELWMSAPCGRGSTMTVCTSLYLWVPVYLFLSLTVCDVCKASSHLCQTHRCLL